MDLDLLPVITRLSAKLRTVDSETRKQIENMKIDIETHKEVERVSTISKDVLKIVSKEYLDQFKIKLEVILSDAVSKIFRDDYLVTFEISESSKRADVCITRKGMEEAVPTKSGVGAGVIEFISLVLRLFFIARKNRLPVLLMDEHLAKIANEYVPAVSEFINMMCERHSLDVLLITHNAMFANHAKSHLEVRQAPAGDYSELVKVR